MGEYAELALADQIDDMGPYFKRHRGGGYWLKKRASKIIWTCRDGKEIEFFNMTDTHLYNSMRLLEREGQTDTNAYKAICAEIARRAV